jgi:hypothetical protein
MSATPLPRCDTRTCSDMSVLVSLALIVSLGFVLGACGVSGTAAQAGTAAASTRSISLTPIPSATADAVRTVTPARGTVTISLDKAQYHAGEFALVTVSNGLAQSISTTDHKSGCSIVALEQQVNDNWQAVEPCHLQTPTLEVELAKGSLTELKIAIPNTPAIYRVTLSYAGGDEGTGGPGGIVHSAEFTLS